MPDHGMSVLDHGTQILDRGLPMPEHRTILHNLEERSVTVDVLIVSTIIVMTGTDTSGGGVGR